MSDTAGIAQAIAPRVTAIIAEHLCVEPARVIAGRLTRQCKRK